MIETTPLKIYYGNRHLAIDTRLHIQNQGVYLITGDNGTGKTSLIRCILGLHRTYEGKVYIEGEDVRTLSRIEIARRVSYLPQATGLEPDITVKEFILQGLYALPDNLYFSQVVELLNLQTYLERSYIELSGGEKQLCRIARAMVPNVRYTLLDEPDSFLSRKNRQRFIDLIGYFIGLRGIIIVSHGALRLPWHTKVLMNLVEEIHD